MQLEYRPVATRMANLITLACDFFDNIGLRDTWMVLHVIAQPFSSRLKPSLQFFFLLGAEVQIRCEPLHFINDLITLFWCQIHNNLLPIERLRVLIRTLCRSSSLTG